METANGGGGNKLPNKEQTMITTLEQHCDKCLDAIIIGSIIHLVDDIFFDTCHNDHCNKELTKQMRKIYLPRTHLADF